MNKTLINSEPNTWKNVNEKNFNSRLPTIMTEGEIAEKMFTKGWKFNVFNVEG